MELTKTFALNKLLEYLNMPSSTYHYNISASKKPDKNAEVKEAIKQIYNEHQGRYGMDRITPELAKRDNSFVRNRKTVGKFMKEMDLKAVIRQPKCKNRQQGTESKTAPNIIERNFVAEAPNQKWTTDVTEFAVAGHKLYLSAIIDMFNSEVIAYELSEKNNLELVTNMLNKALDKVPNNSKLILHSDQGWQYRHSVYQSKLEAIGITQSMSRKGNCLDNALIENFFGLLKSEFFKIKKFKSIGIFKEELDDYINYYNEKRIKLKLGGLSPVEYRTKFQESKK